MNINLRSVLGPVFVLLGVYLFLNKSADMGPGAVFASFWPAIFVIPLALLMHWMYFSITGRRGVGLLVPGGILFTAGMVCQIASLTGSWSTLWPGFILAPAVGLFELYWFGSRNRWLLLPINILTALSLLFFTVFSIGSLLGETLFGKPLLAFILIIAGAVLMVSKSGKRKAY